jgi:hypothetical protein
MGKSYEVPIAYGVVELNIHRSSIPLTKNFEYCRMLNLNCILSLAQVKKIKI